MDTFGPTKAICIKKDARSKCLMTDKPSRSLPLKTKNCHLFLFFQFQILTRTSKDITGWKENWPEISCWGHSVQVSTDRAPWEEETPGWHGLSKTNLSLFRTGTTGKTSGFWNSHVQTCLCIYIYVQILIMHSYPVGFRGNYISGSPFFKPKYLYCSLSLLFTM